MNQGGMLKPALIAGVLLGILSALPLIQWVNSCCCAWVIGGGIFAAYLYVRESAEAVTLGRGLALGLLTGVIGGIVSVLMSLPLLYISFANTKVLEELSKSVEHVPDLSPQVRETLQHLLSDPLRSLSFFATIGGAMVTVMSAIFAMAGGAIGVALFEKRKPGQISAETPPAPTSGPPPELPPPPPLQ